MKKRTNPLSNLSKKQKQNSSSVAGEIQQGASADPQALAQQISNQKTQIGELKKQIEELRHCQITPVTSEHRKKISGEFRTLMIATIQEQIQTEDIKRFCILCYDNQFSAFEIMEIHLEFLETYFEDASQENREAQLSALRNTTMQIEAFLSELYRTHGEKTAFYQMDEKGVSLNLDATPNELQAFHLNLKEQLAVLNIIFIELEQGKTTPQSLDTAFRIMHTIKGTCGVMKHQRMMVLAHEIETVFDLIRKSQLTINTKLMHLFFKSLDVVEALGEELLTLKQSGIAITAIMDELANYTKVARSKTTKKTAGPVNDHFYLSDIQKEMLSLLKTKGFTAFTIKLQIMSTSDMPSITAIAAIRELEKFGKLILSDPEENSIEQCDTIEFLNLLLAFPGHINQLTSMIGTLIDIEPVHCSEFQLGTSASSSTQETGIIKQENLAITKEKEIESIRVDSDKLDLLINLVGELVIIQSQFSRLASTFGNQGEFIHSVEAIERLTLNLRDLVLTIRMIPLSQTFNKYRRMVRDLSVDFKKDIDFVITGEDTRLDKTIIAHVDECLLHLLRNSMDHGIESTDERSKKGKNVKGKLTLSAENIGASVLISVQDDGKGMDSEQIRVKAIEKGLLDPNTHLSEEELLNFIFQPGFSTAKEVTNISGRGVGMDIVKQKIEALNGGIQITSKKEEGSTFSLTLPLSLAIMDGLLITDTAQTFVIPMAMMEECIEGINIKQLCHSGQKFIPIRGELIAFIRLRDIFDYHENEPEEQEIVVVQSSQFRFGIVVDKILGQHQTVIKPLGKLYQHVPFISGFTILGDGDIGLILDIQKLANLALQEKELLTQRT